MADLAKTVTIVEVAHATEMQENLKRRLSESQKADAGRMDSLRGGVLSSVVSENYERAKDDLQGYVDLKSNYPSFQERVDRHVKHCTELIEAIKTKRNFPGLASLSLSKQQELHEKVLEHFEELKQNLKHIEKVERDHKLTDVRSTVWVLRTLCFTVAAVMAVWFLTDMRSGLFSSALTVTSSALDEASSWLVSYMPFLE